MGKAADNEMLKLRATFLNNIAAAFVIAGCVAPYVALLVNYEPSKYAEMSFIERALSLERNLPFLEWVVLAAVMWVIALLFRKFANDELKKIVD